MISFEKKKMGLENYSKEDKEYLETNYLKAEKKRQTLFDKMK